MASPLAAAPDDSIRRRSRAAVVGLADAFLCSRPVGGFAGHANPGPAVEVGIQVLKAYRARHVSVACDSTEAIEDADVRGLELALAPDAVGAFVPEGWARAPRAPGGPSGSQS